MDQAESLVSGTNMNTDKEESHLVLKDINLRIERGEFVVILGENGSGKSALIQAIVSEIRTSEATNPCYLGHKRVVYTNQEPWILTDTIKENILLGSKYNEKRLKKAIRLAELEQDIKTMDKGIDTLCIDRGSNLSGGQRARLTLARAFY